MVRPVATRNTAALKLARNGGLVKVAVAIGPQGAPGVDGVDGSNVLPTDTAIANAIDDSTSLSSAALIKATAYSAAQRVARPALKSVRLVNIGSSIGSTGGSGLDGAATVVKGGNSYTTKAQQILEGRFMHVADAAEPGATSTTILSHFAANVTAYTPGIVFLSGDVFANDANTSVALSTVQTNAAAFVAAIRAIGAQPIMSTVPPRTTATPAGFVAQYNAWLRTYAANEGIPLVDFYSALADPTDGYFFADYTSDGLHPNYLGYAVMASALADTLGKLLTPLTPWRQDSVNNASGNLIKNGMFYGASTGVPPEWIGIAPVGGGSTITYNVVRDATTPARRKLRMTITGSTGQGGVLQVLSPAPTTGQRVRVSGRISVTGNLVATVTGTAQTSPTSSGTFQAAAPCTELPFEFDYTTSGSVKWLTIYGNTGTGTVEVSQIRVEALPVEIEDSFTRANSASVIGASEIGTVTPTVVGTWGITSNTMYPVTAAADDYAMWELGTAEQEATWTISAVPTGSQLTGPIMRVGTNPGECYRFLLGTSGNFVGYKYVAGSINAVMFNFSGQNFAAGDRVRIRCTGTSVRAWKNETEIGTGYTDGTGTLTGTKLGYYIHATGASAVRLDNFFATTPTNL